jgi:hypothetical protein
MPKYNEIRSTMQNISENMDILDIVIQFEDILEKSGLYVYANWDLGEIISGPHIEKHWVEMSLMYPYKKMPEPEGALRITKVGGKVYYSKEKYKEPKRVFGPEDIDDPITKQAKLIPHKVWVIKVRLPKRLIDQEMDEYMDLKDLDFKVDVGELDDEYSEDIPDEFDAHQEQEMGPEGGPPMDDTMGSLDDIENDLS